jgi:hypothetical protein
MGQEKIRKRDDPNYGKPPPAPTHRGLVVSPPLEINGTRLHARSSSIDSTELRFALLYWDKLVWPSSRAIPFASGPDEQFLETEGVLSRPDYTFYGDAAQGIAKSQIQAFLDLEKSEPGAWALAQGENSLLLKDDAFQNGNGGLVELHRAIPIPHRDVPLAEILEFKDRRKDELQRLRNHLDSLSNQIIDLNNLPTDLNAKVSEIDSACADLLQVGKEWQFPVHISNLKASFTLSTRSLVAPAASVWYFGQQFGLIAATAAAAVSGAISTFEIKGDIGFQSLKKSPNPYRYAYLAHKELL